MFYKQNNDEAIQNKTTLSCFLSVHEQKQTMI